MKQRKRERQVPDPKVQRARFQAPSCVLLGHLALGGHGPPGSLHLLLADLAFLSRAWSCPQCQAGLGDRGKTGIPTLLSAPFAVDA